MELLALAAGIRNTCKVQDERELEEVWGNRGRGPTFIHVVLKPGNAPVPNIPLAPAEIRVRFVRAIRGVRRAPGKPALHLVASMILLLRYLVPGYPVPPLLQGIVLVGAVSSGVLYVMRLRIE